MRRAPAVAHQFYPGDAKTLTRMLGELVPAGGQKQQAIAVVSPHAGYVYSGRVAGETMARVAVPEDVIILGPNHHGLGAEVALMAEGEWEMPLGTVPINAELAKLLLAESAQIEADTTAHRFEHSLEVQVPFLQYLQPRLHLTPLVISHLAFATCQEVGRAIARAIRAYARPVLIVASTDMTHYESRVAASTKDRKAIERVLALDPAGLYNTVLGDHITMCGIMPTTITLIAAMELGATRAELVRYTDSGETSGDTDQVVGYAGFVVS
ncbi:MAG: AmmeMemoRadiSam system protein B [Thermodesulfobacteriota bacterium]